LFQLLLPVVTDSDFQLHRQASQKPPGNIIPFPRERFNRGEGAEKGVPLPPCGICGRKVTAERPRSAAVSPPDRADRKSAGKHQFPGTCALCVQFRHSRFARKGPAAQFARRALAGVPGAIRTPGLLLRSTRCRYHPACAVVSCNAAEPAWLLDFLRFVCFSGLSRIAGYLLRFQRPLSKFLASGRVSMTDSATQKSPHECDFCITKYSANMCRTSTCQQMCGTRVSYSRSEAHLGKLLHLVAFPINNSSDLNLMRNFIDPEIDQIIFDRHFMYTVAAPRLFFR